MRHIVKAFLMLFLLSGPLVGYAQTPEATLAPNESVVPLPSTPQTQQTPGNSTPAPTATPQTQQTPGNSTPASTPAAAPPAKTPKTKPKRHHVSGVDIGILAGTGILLVILLKG